MVASDVVNAFQVGLTLTFVCYCFLLLGRWRSVFFDALAAVQWWKWWRVWRNDKLWTAEQWLVVGIVSGFAGAVTDNLYWGVAWSFKFYHHPLEAWLMDWGPLSNIVSRQLVGIWAVYCHLKAERRMRNEGSDLAAQTRAFFLGGQFLFVLMLLTRPAAGP